MSGNGTHKPQRWFPLESNPQLLNKYVNSLGFQSDIFGFCDVYSTEEWATSMVPKPTLAVIFLYPLTEVQEKHREVEKDSDAVLNYDRCLSNGVWWTKQRIGNACGTIGILHALGNLSQDSKDALIRKDSWLDKFLKNSEGLDGIEKAKLLEGDNRISTMHDSATNDETNETDRGNINDKILTHFIAFSNIGNELYELDGRKNGPIFHGKTTSETLLEDSCKVIEKFMKRDPSELRFTILALCPRQE